MSKTKTKIDRTDVIDSNGMVIYRHYTDLNKGYYFTHFEDMECKVCKDDKDESKKESKAGN